jgi:hypothetical protein
MTLHDENSIHLQGIGRVPAIPARDIKPGMILSWNASPRAYEVISIKDVSHHFVEVKERNRSTGQEFTRKLKKSRLVAAEVLS